MASWDSWRARAWGPELPEEWEGEVGDSKVGQVGCREEDGASWWVAWRAEVAGGGDEGRWGGGGGRRGLW